MVDGASIAIGFVLGAAGSAWAAWTVLRREAEHGGRLEVVLEHARKVAQLDEKSTEPVREELVLAIKAYDVAETLANAERK